MDKNRTAVEIFDKLAGLYQEKFMDVSLYGDTFDFFCRNIVENADILEIACGPGNITNYLLKKRPDFSITGIDLSPNMVRLAEINNPRAEFRVMDCRNIDVTEKRYDAILCGFCLPYLSKEETEKLIKDVSRLLKPNGIFYLSTIEDDYEKSGLRKGSSGDEIFMHYYPADYLTHVLNENNLTVLSLDRKAYPYQENLVTDLILISGN